jgi:membrane protein required for colicin V production
MNWLDIVLLLILAWSIATSFRKGLTREVLGLASVVVAFLLALWFYGTAGAYLTPYVSSRSLANLAGFLAVFAAVMLLGSLVGFIVGKFLRVTGLSIVDHALGAAFGALRGTLIAIVLIMAIMAFSTGDRPPESVVRSRCAPYVAGAAHAMVSVAPHELKEGFRKSYGQVKAAWGKIIDKGLQVAPNAQRERKDEREL